MIFRQVTYDISPELKTVVSQKWSETINCPGFQKSEGLSWEFKL